MPAFSGLYDGVFGDGYAALAAQSRPPMLRGLTRVLMQKRGMHGTVNALGRSSPPTIAQIDAQRGSMDVRGGYDYANRAEDALNFVTIMDAVSGAYSDAEEGIGTGGFNVDESVARVPDATEADLVNSYDTTINNGYVKDDADNGATAEALPGVVWAP